MPKREENSLPQAAKPEASIGNKEDNDHQCCNQGEDIFLILKAAGEELRDGEGAGQVGIPAQTLGGKEPVKVGSQSQTDDSPAYVSSTRQISQAGKSHQKITGHVRGLCAHCRHKGTELSAS